MQDKEFILTKEGHQKLLDELELLSTVKRKEVTARIKRAREFGDLKENGEYHEAKKDQGFIEGRIMVIKHMLSGARIIDSEEIEEGVVSVGTTIMLMNLEDNSSEEYLIVGTAEANPFEGKISNESPVASAIMGLKEGDVADVKTPIGIAQYQIVKISKT